MSQLSKSRLLHYITTHVARELFLSLDESIRVAYAKANSRALEDYRNISAVRPRAQMRRYMIDDAWAGTLTKGTPSVLQTFPKGEHYIVVCSNNVTLSHIELHQHKWARPAKHRFFLAKKNAILEPTTVDMFEPSRPDLEDSLHIVVVVLHPNIRDKNQSEPNAILISVPYSDWSGYHLEISLDEVLMAYENPSDSGYVDEAWPTLRDDLRKAEKYSEKKSG